MLALYVLESIKEKKQLEFSFASFPPAPSVFSVDCSTVECPPVQQVVCPLDSYETQVRLTADGCCTLPTRFVSDFDLLKILFLCLTFLYCVVLNSIF